MSHRFSICLLKPEGYVHSEGLRDVADLLVESLKSLGHYASVLENQLLPQMTNIVLGWHLLRPMDTVGLTSNHVIIYQLEQLSDHEGWWNPVKEAVLRTVPMIWDYSQQNVDFLKARGFENVELLPLGYHPALDRIQHLPEDQKDIDVLFYGSINDRRAKVLNELKQHCRVETLFGVYGAERDAYIARAKIVLNMHYYEAQIAEQVRLSYLLNNGCMVVSEVADVNPFCCWTSTYETLAGTCLRLLSVPGESKHFSENRRRSHALAYKTGFQTLPMTEHLRLLVERIGAGQPAPAMEVLA